MLSHMSYPATYPLSAPRACCCRPETQEVGHLHTPLVQVMCSTPLVCKPPSPAGDKLGSCGEKGSGVLGGSHSCPSLPTCPRSLPGAAAGGCQPGVPRLPWQCQTRAPRWCPKGNLPKNWNTCQVKKKRKNKTMTT